MFVFDFVVAFEYGFIAGGYYYLAADVGVTAFAGDGRFFGYFASFLYADFYYRGEFISGGVDHRVAGRYFALQTDAS